ncbi:MAG: cytochrome c biogenesis protein CcsA [Chlamydiales bacterium]|nr:cytochrome c biogenesis protein CcsA [Chlamydiia bacterium]MCP5507185.1 cytochrome c biogenesis protein CcsA [Chlamydiales bacterium]
MLRFFVFLLTLLPLYSDAFPVSYMGRYRPLEAYLQLQDKQLDVLIDEQFTDPYVDAGILLAAEGRTPKEVRQILDARFPLRSRLSSAGDTMKALPGKLSPGEWYDLRALMLQTYNPKTGKWSPIRNFTPYTDAQFESIRSAYAEARHSGDITLLTHALLDAYVSISGTPYLHSANKTLFYPSLLQLYAESIYYRYPWTLILASFYSMVFVSLFLKRRTITFILLIISFLVHSFILMLRCYVLQRPPVSNMYESVLFVPWAAVLLCLTIYWRRPSLTILGVGSIIPLVLSAVLLATGIDQGMENVQAVLDSQFWLTIHVLMVVSSYGTFILSGALGHVYLVRYLLTRKDQPNLESLILTTLYIGTALLICGTILGGVWAAESWGRFWDWDPKEAWAFISICTYLVGIHCYRFGKIHGYGLALGSIAGLMAISFTWYGVNYILGTGLHSYGFGSGGTSWYIAYLMGEGVFLCTAIGAEKAQHIDNKSL